MTPEQLAAYTADQEAIDKVPSGHWQAGHVVGGNWSIHVDDGEFIGESEGRTIAEVLNRATTRWPIALADVERLAAALDAAVRQGREWLGEACEATTALNADPSTAAGAAKVLAACLLDGADICPACGESAPHDGVGITGDPIRHAEGCPMPVLFSRCGLMGDAWDERDRLRAGVERLAIENAKQDAYHAKALAEARATAAQAIGEATKLRDALESLVDEQNGPPLPTHSRAWVEAMAKVDAALGREPVDRSGDIHPCARAAADAKGTERTGG